MNDLIRFLACLAFMAGVAAVVFALTTRGRRT